MTKAMRSEDLGSPGSEAVPRRVGTLVGAADCEHVDYGEQSSAMAV
jgi:hypothetical protein